MIYIGVIPALAAIACIPAYIAKTKGHSFGMWWIGGFLLWPFAMVEAIATAPAGAPRTDRPAVVQTWRPFIALCSILIVALAAAGIYLAVR